MRGWQRDATSLGHCLSLGGCCSASASSPLHINLIAHSHGGNVALEALRHLKNTVRVQRLACLGTPLISFRPALRIVRPFTVSFLTLFMSMFAFLPFIVIPSLGKVGLIHVFTGKSVPDERQHCPPPTCRDFSISLTHFPHNRSLGYP